MYIFIEILHNVMLDAVCFTNKWFRGKREHSIKTSVDGKIDFY